MAINTHSTLSQHWSELRSFLVLHKPDFLVISETGLTPTKAQKLTHLQNYAVLHVTPKGGQAKDSKAKRGISLLVKDKWLPFLSPSIDKELDYNEDLSAIHVAIQTSDKPIHIIGIYGTSTGAANYWTELRFWLQEKNRITKKAQAIMLGDMNQAPNPVYDRKQLETAKSVRQAPEAFTKILEEKFLIDMWRKLHPYPKREYTFRALREDPTDDTSMSRIDLALVTPNLKKDVIECEIRDIPSLLTPDHWPIEINIKLRTPIRNMPPNDFTIPETELPVVDVEKLADPAILADFQSAFTEHALAQIREMPSNEGYIRFVGIINEALVAHVPTKIRVLNKQPKIDEPDQFERTHGHAIRVISSSYHLLENVRAGNPLQHTEAMLKLVRNAPVGFEVGTPPDTSDLEEAVAWFTKVGEVVERLRDFLLAREANVRHKRILEAISRADENAHTNLKRYFRSLSLFKRAAKSTKKQTSVTNEVDPQQRNYPEYEDTSTPEKHNESGMRTAAKRVSVRNPRKSRGSQSSLEPIDVL